eukprot:4269181-Amphidinium_carterae.1
MEADLPGASAQAQIAPQSALGANDSEGSSTPSDFQPCLGWHQCCGLARLWQDRACCTRQARDRRLLKSLANKQ